MEPELDLLIKKINLLNYNKNTLEDGRVLFFNLLLFLICFFILFYFYLFY
jgi:hypothetical protein